MVQFLTACQIIDASTQLYLACGLFMFEFHKRRPKITPLHGAGGKPKVEAQRNFMTH